MFLKNMDYKICVTRFNEDVSWLEPLKNNVVVMNKGKDDITDFSQIKLENYGKEEVGYLQYISQLYNDLPEIVIFIQGKMSDHLNLYPNKQFSDEIDLIKFMIDETHSNGHSLNHFPHNFGENSAHYQFQLANRYPNVVASGYLFGQWFEKYIKPFENGISWFQCGIFGVHRDFIKSRPLSYYKWLISQHQHEINLEVSHFYERSYYYLFNMDDK